MPDPLPADLAAALRATARAAAPSASLSTTFTKRPRPTISPRRTPSAGAPEGTAVVAAAQTAGRGRLGRSWCSPPGAGLYYPSIVRDPRVRAAADPRRRRGGCRRHPRRHRPAARDQVAERRRHARPDLNTNGPPRRRKLAGVLAEASSSSGRLQHVILGLGINISPAAYPADLADRASSIETELGRAVEPGSCWPRCWRH